MSRGYSVGIDIGSACAKTVVLAPDGTAVWRDVRPTGWSSVETAEAVRADLQGKVETGIPVHIVATGYGRVSVPFADRCVTEISCHAKGAVAMFGADRLNVVDIGGQDCDLFGTGRVPQHRGYGKSAAAETGSVLLTSYLTVKRRDRMIYLDNAATTMMKPPVVVSAVTEALTSLGNASRGAYEEALRSNRVIYRARRKLASFFGCPKPEQVIFTNNSTEALNIAISGTIRGGDHVITTVLEHNSVLRPLYRLREERQAELSFVRADPEGRIDYGDFERLIRPDTRAIVCTHASNLTGNLLDLSRITGIAKKHGLLLIVDASQTAGAVPIDLTQSGNCILCFTGHKSMMGPQGTGGLCISGDIDIAPFKVGGTGVQSYLTGQPREYPTRLEAGTLNGHGIAGLLAAVDFISSTGVEAIHARETGLARRFYESVIRIPKVRVYGDFSTWDRCPIVALNISDLDSALVADELACTCGIAVRAGAHCAPLMHKALGTQRQGAVRFSFGYFNTDQEADAAAEAVQRIAGGL